MSVKEKPKKAAKKAEKKSTKKTGDLLLIRRTGGTPCLTKRQRATFRGLGLMKNQRVVLLEDNNATRGMVNKMIQWVEVKLIPAQENEKAQAAFTKRSNPASLGYRVVTK